jgi:hypothetical protein
MSWSESLIFCFAIGGLAAVGYRVAAPASEHKLVPQARNFGIGMYWSCMYEHVTWRHRDASPPTGSQEQKKQINKGKTKL